MKRILPDKVRESRLKWYGQIRGRDEEYFDKIIISKINQAIGKRRTEEKIKGWNKGRYDHNWFKKKDARNRASWRRKIRPGNA